jgi:O-antigen/teichoic acid export membrane protein
MGRFLVAVTAVLVGLVVAGALAIWLFKALLGLAFYLVVGAAVVGGGAYLYYRAKRAIEPGTRTRNRLDAAAATYRQRNR